MLIFPLVSIGQDSNLKVDQNITVDYSNNLGMQYVGKGIYKIKKQAIGFKGKKGLEKDIRKQINQLVKTRNLKFEILSVDSYNEPIRGTIAAYPTVEITFKLMKLNGELLIGKEEAKKEILELREYLDLGIITQEEFDKRAESLKKILLGN